ncbi:hypothetical protein DFP72DRAFT_968113 [Ephemerocybe angulata]|uniref:DUF7223 domain-containing protein n=1 Tax=Ephemerocybe angulata TaxID=980116 RepID=A0A8H6HUM6_9AGAR|nr:hypothetical protein DFP72DRAFT_968113 [Tulosesus angulatus]
MFSSSFVFLALIGAAHGAANDWSKPCLSGVCFYDLPTSDTAASGTLKIWGATESIADITTAAGWEILDCKKDSLSQDIRLVCSGSQSDCSRLYDTIGAVGKIARLPESCGQNAFAHISRAWVPEDQSIPDSISRRMVKRDHGEQPQVHALHIDTNFAAVDASRVGVVNFSIQGANVPGAEVSASSSAKLPQKRQIDVVGDVLEKAADGISDLNNVNINESTTLPPFSIDKSFNILNETLSCPPVDVSLKVDVTAKAHAMAAIGVVAEGTIVPPKIDKFSVTSTLSADINGEIVLKGGLSGSIESERIPLFEVGVPGLAFPGILTVGPSFKVEAQATANLDINADLKVGVNYKVDKASLVFPPMAKETQEQDGAFHLKDTPLDLSVSPSVNLTGSLAAHLIPSLNLGIDALGGVAEASIFLELDASATLELSLQSQAQVNTTVNRAKRRAAPYGSNSNSAARLSELPGGSTVNRRIARAIAMHQAAQKASTPAGGSDTGNSTDLSGSFAGCFEILAGLDVNAGANAAFFDIFDTETVVPLFSTEFELFKKCFGSQPQATRRDLGLETRASVLPPILNKLVCPPTSEVGDALSLVNQIISVSGVNGKKKRSSA